MKRPILEENMALDLIDPKKYRQLFLDDFAVENMTGVYRTLHQPEKVGPAVRPDRSRGERHGQVPPR